MYSFDDLLADRRGLNGFSLAYWLGVLRMPLPKGYRTASELSGAMSHHFDIEEQVGSHEQLRTIPELLFGVFSPISPVTLTEAWSPIPMMVELLGKPVDHGMNDELLSRPASAVFEPKPLRPSDFDAEGEHARHALRLLQYASKKALREHGRILIVAEPGWSYSSWKETDGMPREIQAIMLEARYEYTDRIARPGRRQP